MTAPDVAYTDEPCDQCGYALRTDGTCTGRIQVMVKGKRRRTSYGYTTPIRRSWEPCPNYTTKETPDD